MIKSINHVQVTIPFGGEEEAKRFYGGVLGLKQLIQPESLRATNSLWFELGALQLHLGCEDNAHRTNSRAHVAYNVDNIEQCRRTFEALGVEIYENTQIEGIKRFDIRDPFGNRLEIMEMTSV
ncbi:glyoxalase [Psychromonas sp. B3M02]|uniref:VOC family protein n=1 Tax=Psychromonas sp. B3M02 TaxID=2267226 RepID=UPI000DE80CF3|nr:VOC family protein [Psychromonas sp. B3M02]RBW46710.1 glyoxalase [Psychromonas sp. B3M02]